MEPNEFNSYENTRHNEKLLIQLYEIHKQLDEGNQNSENLNDSIKILTNVMVYDQQNTDNRGPRYSNIPDKDTNESTTPKPENNDSKGTSLSESLATQESQKRQQQLDIAKTKLEDRHSMMVDLNITQIELLKKLVEGERLSRGELSELSKRTAGADGGLGVTDVAVGNTVAKFLPKLLPVALMALKGIGVAGLVTTTFLASYGLTRKFLEQAGYYKWIEENTEDWITSEKEKVLQKRERMQIDARTALNKTRREDIDVLADSLNMNTKELNKNINDMHEMSAQDRKKFLDKFNAQEMEMLNDIMLSRVNSAIATNEISKVQSGQIEEQLKSFFSVETVSDEVKAMRKKGMVFDTKLNMWVKPKVITPAFGEGTLGFRPAVMEQRESFTRDAQLIAATKLKFETAKKVKEFEADQKAVLDSLNARKKELEEAKAKNKAKLNLRNNTPVVKNEKTPVNERIKSTIPLSTKEGPVPTGIMLQDPGVRDDGVSKNLEKINDTLVANNESNNTLPMIEILNKINFGIGKLYDKPSASSSTGNGTYIIAPDSSNSQL